VATSLGATRVLATMLFDVKPADPAVLAAIASLLAATALVASDLPARRATRIDPLDALRAEQRGPGPRASRRGGGRRFASSPRMD